MDQKSLDIIVQAILDKSKSESQINAQIKQIKSDPLLINVKVDDKEIRSQLGNVQKQRDAFEKKNLGAIDVEIKKREEASKKYSALLKEQMLERQRLQQQEARNAQSAFNLGLDKQKLGNNMQVWLRENSKAVQQFGGQVSSMLERLKSADSVEFGNIKREFSTMQSEVEKLGLAGRTMGDEFVYSAQKFTSWFLIGGLIAGLSRSLYGMVDNVKQIDAAMTELRKVTDETERTYNKFLDGAAVRAKTLGATLTDVVTATADYARLGYSVSQASDLADASVVYKNVGDGISDITDASESLISTMKAFGIQASDSMSIVDRFNEVGNNFAISSRGVGDALMRSASSLAGANNTLEESIGLITAANNVVKCCLAA